MPSKKVVFVVGGDLETIAGEAAHDFAQGSEMILRICVLLRSREAEAPHVATQPGKRPFIEEAGQIIGCIGKKLATPYSDKEFEVFTFDLFGLDGPGGLSKRIMREPERRGRTSQPAKLYQELGIRGTQKKRGEQRVFIRPRAVDVVKFGRTCTGAKRLLRPIVRLPPPSSSLGSSLTSTCRSMSG